MQQREADLRNQLGSAAHLLREVGLLKQQLKSKDEEITNWKAEANRLEEDLRTSQQNLEDLQSSNNWKVDKTLVKNLFLSYFNTPEAKRSDAVHVLGGLLDFTPEEMAQVGSGSTTNGRGGEAGGGGEKRGWLSSLLPFGRTPKSPPEREHSFGTPTKASVADKSLPELFVSFLQNESESKSPLQTRAAMSQVINPLLRGISLHETSFSQGQPSNMLYQPLASANPTLTKHLLDHTPQSGTRPLPSGISECNSGPFATPQNCRSTAVPLQVVSPARPGREPTSPNGVQSYVIDIFE